ncbi:unnamed protein product [Moneuplotes crassus]|uniref:PA14 domain-containing protein n=1 Tax=Euplotes crassus TaxID=5936 RepID=A0AAD1XHD7_EUPCR|nr:unnamed protein product [Moneuplotes crassus]
MSTNCSKSTQTSGRRRSMRYTASFKKKDKLCEVNCAKRKDNRSVRNQKDTSCFNGLRNLFCEKKNNNIVEPFPKYLVQTRQIQVDYESCDDQDDASLKAQESSWCGYFKKRRNFKACKGQKIGTTLFKNAQMIIAILLLSLIKLSACAANATKSVITSSIPTTLLPFTPSQSLFKLNNSAGTNLTSGGDKFYITIKNKCTWTSDFSCSPASPPSSTLSSDINDYMTDNGDGTYSYTFSVTKEGTITYKVLLLEQGKVSAEYYTNGGSFIGRKTVGNINFNFGRGSIYGGYKDNVVIHYRSYLKPPRSATFSFSVKYDDYGTVYIDGSRKTSGGQTTTRSFSMYMQKDRLYNVHVRFQDNRKHAYIYFKWNGGGGYAAVQSRYFYYPTKIKSGNIKVKCQSGYKIQAFDLTSCTEVCGDGILTPSEQCDDANTSGGDGCAGDCRSIEYNHICNYNSSIPKHVCLSCGIFGYPNISHTGNSTCIPCDSGFRHLPSNPNTCTEFCSDGIQTSGEICDDKNAVDGDGCSSDCHSIEYNYICVYNSTTAKDECTSCGIFAYPNTEREACIPCELGFRHLPEFPDTCTEYCSDGIRTSGEKCDDGNTSDGDGCSADCKTIEDQHICVYNSTIPQDECSRCLDTGVPNTIQNECVYCKIGYIYNEGTQNECVSVCGDGLIVAEETCDDANTLVEDGCNDECKVEQYYKCTGLPSNCKKDIIGPDRVLQIIGQTVSLLIILDLGSQVLLSFVFGHSLSSMWMLINISQIIQYSAMMTLYFPKIIITFYSYIGFSNFEIGIFSDLFFKLIDVSEIEGRDPFDYRFRNQDIGSTNIFLNCSDIFITLLLFILLNIFYLCISLICSLCGCKRHSSKEDGCCRRMTAHFSSRVNQSKNDLFFNSILRVTFEVYLPLSFASIYNLYDMRLESNLDYSSQALSAFFLLIFLIVPIIILVIFCCCKVTRYQKLKGSFNIFFKDLKMNRKLVMMDHFLFIIRRLALSLLLIFRWKFGFQQVCIFIAICLLVLLWKIIIRPFQSKLLNFQDILFELFLLTIIILYLNFNSESSELSTEGLPHISGSICVALIIIMVLTNYVVSIIMFFIHVKYELLQDSEKVKPKLTKTQNFVPDKTGNREITPETPSFTPGIPNSRSHVSNSHMISNQAKGVPPKTNKLCTKRGQKITSMPRPSRTAPPKRLTQKKPTSRSPPGPYSKAVVMNTNI